MRERTCVTCGATFTPRDEAHTRPRQRCFTCHPGVPDAERSPERRLRCATCGNSFTSRMPQARYCSRPCYSKRPRPSGRDKRTNRNRGTDATQRHRARVIGASIEQFKHADIYERDRWVCQLCGQRIDQRRKFPDMMSASLDHIIPLSKGGEHVKANVQTAHFLCNSRKSDNAANDQLRLIG